MLFNWTKTIIKDVKDFQNMLIQLNNISSYTLAAFDTETNGLHIINSRPFLFQFGFIDETTSSGYAYVIDIEEVPGSRDMIKTWHTQAKKFRKYLAHNIKFDMHMLENIGCPLLGFTNLSDTMFTIRYSHDNIPTRHGGPTLDLKSNTVKYVDPQAKSAQSTIKRQQSQIAKRLSLTLKSYMHLAPPPPPSWGCRSWTLKCINNFFKDPLVVPEDLPNIETYYYYKEWYKNEVVPLLGETTSYYFQSSDIPYSLVDRDLLLEYGLLDIVYTLELQMVLMPRCIDRGMENALAIEEQLIYPLYHMERCGFEIDIIYLRKSQKRMKDYIKQQRQHLIDLIEYPVTANQHAVIKTLLNTKYQLPVVSTGAEELTKLLSDLKHEQPDHDAIDFIETIQELRTLEKWYSTYLIRFVRDTYKSTRVYTSINQVGTVSGRVTSDFQQFPKNGLTTRTGQELFQPRRMIINSKESIIYLDYSQIELRLQAVYTILLDAPDLNLCRAYMPYQCRSDVGLFEFNYNNPEHIAHWDTGEWVQLEDNEPWVPTDVHGATTKIAFNITEDDPTYKTKRSLGKRVNFAKNYGAQRGRIAAMFPEFTPEEITAIDEAYYKAFPGVRAYQQYCYTAAFNRLYVSNLMGIKYYGVSGHNLINMLIQGSGAYFLKQKIIDVYQYMQVNQMYSSFQMNIHDELSFEKDPRDDISHFKNIKRIMETWEDCPIPIVADAEITYTSWADKEDLNL